MAVVRLTTPLKTEDTAKLKIGDKVLITGEIYTARDLAHKRLLEMIDKGEQAPFDMKGSIIYYVGPAPTKPGQVINSCGPTTSYRMDPYTGRMLELGAKAFIGKGNRSPEVVEALKKHKAVYMAATGGAAALIAKAVKGNETIAFEDLGAEAIRRLTVEDFPATVINDVNGNDLYQEGIKKYARA
jgi:fumarate hydratase subunit beta